MFKDKVLFLIVFALLFTCSASQDFDSFYYFYDFRKLEELEGESRINVSDHFGQVLLSVVPLSMGVDKTDNLYSVFYNGDFLKSLKSDSKVKIEVQSYSNYFSFQLSHGNFYNIFITNETKDVIQKYKIKTYLTEPDKLEIQKTVIFDDFHSTKEIFTSSNKVYPITLKKR